jgi:hypothetical protein
VPDPINLRLARKAKIRATKEQIGAENRERFGQSKAHKNLLEFDSQKTAKSLDDASLSKTNEPD